MIFVTVGTHDQNFNRLVRGADELAGLIDEQVVIQRGCSDYLPKRAQYFDWTTSKEMENWIEKSRVVIAQAGAGTIMMALQSRKPLVLAPRLSEYKENHNDHQVQLASALNEAGSAVLLVDLSGESMLIATIKASNLKTLRSNSDSLVNAIRQRLNSWQKPPKEI